MPPHLRALAFTFNFDINLHIVGKLILILPTSQIKYDHCLLKHIDGLPYQRFLPNVAYFQYPLCPLGKGVIVLSYPCYPSNQQLDF